MKRLLLILFFLIIPFFSPPSISAVPIINDTPSASSSTPAASQTTNLNPWQQFWKWLVGIFIKDYDIPTEINNQQKNFTDYGEVDDPKNENINSSENRSTSSNQQFYFKGQYIKDVIDGLMSDKVIAKICDQKIVSLPNPCGEDFKISCLARYFVEANETFLYSNQNGSKTNLSDDFKKSIENKSSDDCIILSQPQFAEYQNIYLNFFRVPPEYSDAILNQNATRVIRNPIPASNQNDIPTNTQDIEKDIKVQQENLNKNFIPEDKDWSGLNSLRPASTDSNGW